MITFTHRMASGKTIDVVQQFVDVFGNAIDKHYHELSPEYKKIILELLRERISQCVYDSIDLLNEKDVELSIKEQLLFKDGSIDLF